MRTPVQPIQQHRPLLRFKNVISFLVYVNVDHSVDLKRTCVLSLSARYDVPLKITTDEIPYQIAKMLHH